MSRASEIPGLERLAMSVGDRPHELYRSGSGPDVAVIHEMPGLHPGVIEFGRILVAVAYTVYLPSLSWTRRCACDDAGDPVVGGPGLRGA